MPRIKRKAKKAIKKLVKKVVIKKGGTKKEARQSARKTIRGLKRSKVTVIRESRPLATSPMPRPPLKTKIIAAKKRPFPVLNKPKR